jgi:peptidoglycan/LPS O-acetylase OafA/YrhL
VSEEVPSPAQPSRLSSLDGLRGIAAVAVVFHHAALAAPLVSDPSKASVTSLVNWWIYYTPLKLITAGTEAVTIFFVLSGMVLALPVLKSANYDWMNYYPRRFVRLYLPVVASIGFAAILVLIHPQVLGAQMGGWTSQFSFKHLTWPLIGQSFDIMGGLVYLNNPLWTIRWEMIFSLSLPIFVVLAVRTARWWIWGIVVALVIIWVGYMTGNAAFQLLPVFYAGTLLAVRRDSLSAWAVRATRSWWMSIVWLAALILGGMLLVASWSAGTLFPASWYDPALAASALGAILIVAISFLWKPAIAVLTVAPVRWLGRVSFSLYLVHAPILIAVANFYGPGHPLKVLVVTLVLALIAAELFARFVEQPAHRLSKRIGAASSLMLSSRHGAKSSAEPVGDDGSTPVDGAARRVT